LITPIDRQQQAEDEEEEMRRKSKETRDNPEQQNVPGEGNKK
jgi:hypothetical protein